MEVWWNNHVPLNMFCTLPETNSSHLKMDAWNTIVSFWGPAYFQGRLLLVSGSVSIQKKLSFISGWIRFQGCFLLGNGHRHLQVTDSEKTQHGPGGNVEVVMQGSGESANVPIRASGVQPRIASTHSSCRKVPASCSSSAGVHTYHYGRDCPRKRWLHWFFFCSVWQDLGLGECFFLFKF